MADSPLILVVEDEFFLQADLDDGLSGGGFATEVVSSGEEALTLLMTKRHDALVTDVKLAGVLSGWEVARQIREKDPSFPVIYVTAYQQDWAANGVANSVLIPKPFTSAKVVAAVWSLLNQRTADDLIQLRSRGPCRRADSLEGDAGGAAHRRTTDPR